MKKILSLLVLALISLSATARITPPPTDAVALDPEWGMREGVFVRYPFSFAPAVFSKMVDEIQDVAIVYIVVSSNTQKNNCINYLNTQGVPIENIEWVIYQTNSIWNRDYGPWFVWQPDSSLGIIDMPYAWAPNWTMDDYFPEFLEGYWGMDYYGPEFWHDGGNMMTDGHGLMMMSTYVNESNPGMSNLQICQFYRDYFGQDTIYIFEEIDFDLTGHIDLWAKMLNDTTIMVAQMELSDPNYHLVESHAAYMATIPTHYGTPFNIVRCPMPPLASYGGGFYYKSYINSLLINHTALVPTANHPYDQQALDAYQQALGPDWEVVGIPCLAIAPYGGAIHCTSIAVPLDPSKFLVEADLFFEPVNPPVMIPASGGSFAFDVQIENLEMENITFDFWIDVTLPNGSTYGPILKRTDITVPSMAMISRELTQMIPASAPAGQYGYNGYVGRYAPRVISAEAAFNFEKAGVSATGADYSDWNILGWEEEDPSSAASHPFEFALISVHPNPFNPSTALSYNMQAAGRVSLTVYDISGREVAKLVNGWRDAGSHEVVFDGSGLSSGLYVYRLEAGEFKAQGKMVLMK